MMEFVSSDDDIPNWMESQKNPWFQTTNQMSFHEFSDKMANSSNWYRTDFKFWWFSSEACLIAVAATLW